MLNVTARQDLMNKIVETLGVVVEDARFEFKENQMQATVVDASHVAMIDMKVDAAAFDTWEIEDADLALELRKVKELISLGGADDLIEMAYTKDSGVLTLNLGKIDRNIRPLDPSTVNSPNLPNIDIPSSIEINGASLAQALRAAKQVGDLVNFSIDGNSFTVHVQGQTDSVTVSFSKDELESLSCSKPRSKPILLDLPRPALQGVRFTGDRQTGLRREFPSQPRIHLQRRCS